MNLEAFFDMFFLFQVFDKGGCGYITASDLRAVLQCMGEDLTEEESKLSIAKKHKTYELKTKFTSQEEMRVFQFYKINFL